MRRRMRLGDVLLGLPLAGLARARKAAEISARRRRADYRRRGSLTYNRQQAARLYRQVNELDP